MQSETEKPLVRLRAKDDAEELRISETVLKKRSRDLKGAAERAWVRSEAKQNVKRLRKTHLIVSAEKLIVERRRVAADRRRFQRTFNLLPPKVKTKSKIAFAVRNTLRNASRETRRVLHELGLTTFYTGKFIPNNQEYLHKLRLVEPFVFWGYPSLDLIKTLYSRRGCVRRKHDVGIDTDTKNEENGNDDDNEKEESNSELDDDDDDDDDNVKDDKTASRTIKRKLSEQQKQWKTKCAKRIKRTYEPLSGNTRVEDDLGHLGLLCIEDLVDQTYKCGHHFTEVSNFVGPFFLSNLQHVEGLNSEKTFVKGFLPPSEFHEKLLGIA